MKKSFKYVELMSGIITEQTDDTMEELGKDIDIDYYIGSEIKAVEISKDEFKLLYKNKPTLVFKGVKIFGGEKTLILRKIKIIMLVAAGIRKKGDILKVRLVFDTDSDVLAENLYFYAKDVCQEQIIDCSEKIQ